MTNEETIHKLTKLKMPAFLAGFRELIESVPDKQITLEEHIGMLIDREWTDRENRRLDRRIKDSRVYVQAAPDQVICDPARGLERALWRDLTGGGWVRSKLNVVIVGATSPVTFCPCFSISDGSLLLASAVSSIPYCTQARSPLAR